MLDGRGVRVGMAAVGVAGMAMFSGATAEPLGPVDPPEMAAERDRERKAKRLCAREPQPSAFQREVAAAIRMRRQFGFRHDRAYVRRLQRSRPGPRTVLTKRERAYMRMRARLTRAAPTAAAYLREQPADLSSGVSIEDSPGRPYVLVKVTRDPAAHEQRLRERFPYPDHLEVERVAYSLQELDDLAERIVADREALAEDGFRLQGTASHSRVNAVTVDLITRRSDAESYFGDRYGPAVATNVIATRPTRLECRSPDGYRGRPDARTLRIHWLTGPSRVVAIRVREGLHKVAIGVVERIRNGARLTIGINRRRKVELRRPLGDRQVIGATTGRLVDRASGPIATPHPPRR